MAKKRDKLSIKTRLLLMQLVTCAFALIVSGFIFSRISHNSNRNCALEYLQCLSEMLARNAIPALKSGSPEEANKVVDTLRNQASILSANIYDAAGTVLASYIRSDRTHACYVAPCSYKKYEVFENHIHVFCPAEENGVLLGSVCIEDDMGIVSCVVWQNTLALLAVFAGAFLIAALLAYLLQRSILIHIFRFTKSAKQIARSSDYSARMPEAGVRELAMLGSALNEMLNAVQKKIREDNDTISELRENNENIKCDRDRMEMQIALRADEIKRAGDDLQLEMHEHELSERMLRQTLEKLKTTNRELERFAQVSAHDLQEPLRKIQTFANLLLTQVRDSQEQQTEKYIDVILKSAMQMQLMIHDFLVFSSLGRKKTIFRRVDLNHLIDFVISDLDSEINNSKTKIKVGILPDIDAEKDLMRQMFRHLIGNAVKFKKNDVSPEIKIYAKDNSDGTVTICIEDNGIGFDSKYAAKVFEIFQRLRSRRTYGGTGIGLAICKRIVDVHSGEIRIESESGVGTAVFVTLPYQQKYERS